MVARRILVPPVRVRILPRQQVKLQSADFQLTAFFFNINMSLIFQYMKKILYLHLLKQKP